MNQMTTEHPNLEPGEEPEDFEKIVKTTSGHLAICDAGILRNLDNPAVADAVVFSTKQTVGEEQAFKVTGSYDDSILRELIMIPATIEDTSKHEENKVFKAKVDQSKEKMESIQIMGKGGDPVQRQLTQVERPLTMSRQKRNRQRKKTKRRPVQPERKMAGRIGQSTSAKSREPKPEKEKPKSECYQFLKHIRNNTITEEFLDNMKHDYEILISLRQLRQMAMEGREVSNFDLIYCACNILDKHLTSKIEDKTHLIENLLRDGLPLV